MSQLRTAKRKGLSRIWHAALASVLGFIYIFKTEAAFRQELVLVIISVPLAFGVTDNRLLSMVLVSCSILVLVVEVINTGIEAIVDRISLEHHQLSGAAKDMGSLAVLLSIVNASCWWCFVLISEWTTN